MTAAPAVVQAPVGWSPFDDALARAADRGLAPAFWWRDDDATGHTPALDRLLALADAFDVPVALAAVPRRTEPSLPSRLAGAPLATVLVHGLAHANHAPPGTKRAEFGQARPVEVLAADAGEALASARAAFGERLVAAFVPPWNRIAPGLVPRLAELGYVGLSRFKDRAAPCAAPGLREVNAHLDPIDWRGTRGLADPDRLVATLSGAVLDRLNGRADRDEPIGLLTHHLAHEEAVWRFCSAFLERARAHHGMRFLAAKVLFVAKAGMERSAPDT